MEIRLSGSPGEVRAALLDQDRLIDIALWRPGNPDGWGDIHAVRIIRHFTELGGAFVQLLHGEEGFLTTRKKEPEGSLLCAQIIRAAQNGKGVRLKPITPPDNFSSIQLPSLFRRGPSPLEDLAKQASEAPLLIDDMAITQNMPHALKRRIRRVTKSFDSFLENEWDELAQPKCSLGTFTAHITPTPSLTAIDLDTSSHPDFAANVACFPLLLRQIRLRNLSGTILIDPAGVRSHKRPALVPFLRKAVDNENDPVPPKVMGITPSGLLELTRPRRRPPLHELLTSSHGQALTILRDILRENRQGSTLNAPPSFLHALEKDPIALKEFTLAYGKPLHLRATPPEIAFTPWSLS
ncbi:hypothetical protein GS501_09120 [Saccharibacter sp. 17.LH.SD]|uniref:ribonuclease E/G n=1 Tax=Saccharibacter sp. 17.LH.SD TaxID=2689393 RepID=UPI00137001D4|nr:ribonuclease E/G [Saccharibacter sp. 17.LH.SD]MXV45191.1 hypothetical protein [Saccharibacter sp. 17.LH.SD]